MKKNRWILWVVPLLLIFVIGGFVIWANSPAQPETVALQALDSDRDVSVIQAERWIEFYPTSSNPETALVFYPGGRVDYRAYAPLMRTISAAGYSVFLVKMPFNLAVFDINRAEEIITEYEEIRTWAIGGHSLGGSMAASYTDANLEEIAGLVLWASYPAESNDLSDADLAVLSISASLDGLATTEKIEASVDLLPEDTKWVVITGGNHAQFGSYGSQRGDLSATVSREAQQMTITDETIEFLDSISR